MNPFLDTVLIAGWIALAAGELNLRRLIKKITRIKQKDQMDLMHVRSLGGLLGSALRTCLVWPFLAFTAAMFLQDRFGIEPILILIGVVGVGVLASVILFWNLRKTN